MMMYLSMLGRLEDGELVRAENGEWLEGLEVGWDSGVAESGEERAGKVLYSATVFVVPRGG